MPFASDEGEVDGVEDDMLKGGEKKREEGAKGCATGRGRCEFGDESKRGASSVRAFEP